MTTTKRGRARNDRPKSPALPKTQEELQALLDKTWSEACDAEFARTDEEYRTMREAVAAFDVGMGHDGSFSWENLNTLRPPRLLGCSAETASETAKRLREILEATPRLRALDAFEAIVGLKIDDERLARIDAKAVRALLADHGRVGLVLNNLKLSLEQLDGGRQHIASIVERMEAILREQQA